MRIFVRMFEEFPLVVQEVHIRRNVLEIPRKTVTMLRERSFRPVKHKTLLVVVEPGRRSQFAAVKTVYETTRVKRGVELGDATLQKPVLDKRRLRGLLRNRYGVVGLQIEKIKRSKLSTRPARRVLRNPGTYKD